MRTCELLLPLVVLLLAWNSIICLAGRSRTAPQQQNNGPTYPLTKIHLTPMQMNAISLSIVRKLKLATGRRAPMLKIDGRNTYQGKSRDTMLIIESDVVRNFGPNNPDVLSGAQIKKQTKAGNNYTVVGEIKQLVSQAIDKAGLENLRNKLTRGSAKKTGAPNSYAAHYNGKGGTQSIGLTIIREPNHGADDNKPNGITKYHVKLRFYVTTSG